MGPRYMRAYFYMLLSRDDVIASTMLLFSVPDAFADLAVIP